MNLATMVQELRESTRLQFTENAIRRKIIEAIAFHRDRRLWFSDRTFRFTLTANREGYTPGDGFGLPGDLVEIVGPRIWLTLDGESGQRVPIYRVPTDDMELSRAVEFSPGEPYRWDFSEGQLRFSPAPDSSEHVVDGRYVRDLGVPQAIYDGSAWSFKTPDGANALDGAYTSHWFGDGRYLIRHYATYLLLSDTAGDEAGANRALQRWLEVKAALEEETEGRTAGGVRRTLTLGI